MGPPSAAPSSRHAARGAVLQQMHAAGSKPGWARTAGCLHPDVHRPDPPTPPRTLSGAGARDTMLEEGAQVGSVFHLQRWGRAGAGVARGMAQRLVGEQGRMQDADRPAPAERRHRGTGAHSHVCSGPLARWRGRCRRCRGPSGWRSGGTGSCSSSGEVGDSARGVSGRVVGGCGAASSAPPRPVPRPARGHPTALHPPGKRGGRGVEGADGGSLGQQEGAEGQQLGAVVGGGGVDGGDVGVGGRGLDGECRHRRQQGHGQRLQVGGVRGEGGGGASSQQEDGERQQDRPRPCAGPASTQTRGQRVVRGAGRAGFKTGGRERH